MQQQRKRILITSGTLLLSSLILSTDAHAQNSPHQQEVKDDFIGSLSQSDYYERLQLEANGALFPLKKQQESKDSRITPRSAAPDIDDDFLVVGYAQTYGSSVTYTDHYHWEALTHVASTFITFDNTGSITNPGTWTGRDSNLLAGGAAEAAGTKVLMTVLNDSFDVTVIDDVMTDAGKRSDLVDDIVALLSADSYSHGVTFDFEPFSWSASATDGMEIFIAELRSDLDTAGLSNHEISIYADPSPNTTQWDMSELVAAGLDYIFYSGYDFASGNTATAITRHNNGFSAVTQMDFYFDDVDTVTADDGIDPSKLIYVISAYGRRWEGVTAYNTTGSNPTSWGFTDAMYDTTLNQLYSGPYTANYTTGDEAGYYTYNDGGADYVVTWEDPRAIAMEVGSALSYPGTGDYAGRRLGGVGFWSLMWMAEGTSYDMIGASSVTRTRTYPHIYQACQELLASPGIQDVVLEGFEGLNFRWNDPNDGPDDSGDTDFDSSRSLVVSPAGSGQPSSTTNAMALDVDFESAGKLFFRHEILASNLNTSIPDTNAAIGFFDTTTEIQASVHTAASYADMTIRMLIFDSEGELEMSPATSLISSGWQTLTWNLNDGVSAYTTSEPAFNSGDGILDTDGGGAKDIAFAGFLIESTAASAGTITIDEILYRHANPTGDTYVINELRYDGSSGEYVEIYGPAGSLPSGFQVVLIDGQSGTRDAISVIGSIPDDGGGFGYFVFGDTDVTNVDDSTGLGTLDDDFSDNDPSAVQLYDSLTGGVYDSVVYEAFGGLDELLRLEQLGVADEGYPWNGRVAGGTDSSGQKSALGRYPDGQDANINYEDFSLQLATPGASNGGTIDITGLPVEYDFSTAPSSAWQTFQSFGVTTSAVGPSPTDNDVYRCIDTSGGGVMAFFGDKSLGTTTTGYHVAGDIYLPDNTEPAQAISVGFCATQGSTFFSASRDANSYENGYMLIYENLAGVDLDDGRPDHAGTIEFVWASHDNTDGAPVTLLGSASAPLTGDWTDFELRIDPSAGAGSQLIATVGGVTIYQGAIPEGGPTSGAVSVGFRENHSGAPTSVEGTWIDNLRIGQVGTVPVELDYFSVD